MTIEGIKRLEEEIKGRSSYIILVLTNAKNYQEVYIEIIKTLTSSENTPGVYITLNKPYSTLNSIFEKEGIDSRMLFFIDAISRTSGEPTKVKNCLFIGSPQYLSDISIALTEAVNALPSPDKFIFFDSLSTLLIYNQAGTVAKFFHFLSGKMRAWNIKGIILSLEGDKDELLLARVSQFCDATIDLRGG